MLKLIREYNNTNTNKKVGSINLKKAELISLKKPLQVSNSYKKLLHTRFNLVK